MQTPMPQAIASSTAHWLYARNGLVAISATDDSIAMGPQA